jgi:hypothetical protein
MVALLLAGMLAAATAWADPNRPPTNLKKVGDHWTPWDPPAPGPGDYIIQKGDTLWDLAGKWLGDPFLWPQVWDENRYILDSHWIYPGDPLVVPGKPQVVPPEGQIQVIEEPPEGEVVEEGPPPTAEALPTPLYPVADAADVYCSGYIAPVDALSAPLWIAGHEYENEMLATGDAVYLNQGRNQGITPGSEWGVIRRTRTVKHPVTGEVLGRYVRRLGRVRVLATQADTSIAVVEMACDGILDRDELVSWTPIPIPEVTALPEFDPYDVEPTGGPLGYVVAVLDDVTAVGAGHVIHVDLGQGAGVQPGQLLTLYRDNGALPRMMLGQAVILTVDGSTSTAKIEHSVRESFIGDRVEGLP